MKDTLRITNKRTAPSMVSKASGVQSKSKVLDIIAAPELEQSKGIINLSKDLSFAFGMLLKEVTQNTDLEVIGQIEALVQQLTMPEPSKRPSIKEALNQIENIGDNSYIERAIYTNYVNKIKERMESKEKFKKLDEAKAIFPAAKYGQRQFFKRKYRCQQGFRADRIFSLICVQQETTHLCNQFKN